MKKYNVNTIYRSFMGEVNPYGIGAPCTFVRFQGCNLRCYFKTLGVLCDTPEGLNVEKTATEMTALEIMGKCSTKLVCLTGGEPLLHADADLIKEFIDHGFIVCIETNGSVPISANILRLLDSYPVSNSWGNVHFIMDAKSKSTGEESTLLKSNLHKLRVKDFLKFVFYDNADLEEFLDKYTYYRENTSAVIAVGLFWGTPHLTYDHLFKVIQEKGLNVFVNMQTHKMCCLVDSQEGNITLNIPKDL